jgi:hypothetical protein
VPAGSLLGVVLFTLFALLSALGAYLIGAHFRGRRAGFLAAVATLVGFAALAAAMLAIFATFAVG